jgi:hypothetical protein
MIKGVRVVKIVEVLLVVGVVKIVEVLLVVRVVKKETSITSTIFTTLTTSSTFTIFTTLTTVVPPLIILPSPNVTPNTGHQVQSFLLLILVYALSTLLEW